MSRQDLLSELESLRGRIAELESGESWLQNAAIDPAFPGERRDFEALLDNLPGVAYRCHNDAHWTMVYLSAGCERLTGYAPDALIGNRERSYEHVIHPDDRDASNERIRAAVAEKGEFEDVYRIVRRGGEVRWVWDRARIVSEPGTEPEILEGYIADITQRKAAEDAVRDGELRLKAIFDNSPSEIYLKDHEGRYVQISRRFEQLFDVKDEEIRGKYPEDAHYPELAATTRAQDLEVLNTGKVVEREEKAIIEGEERTLLTLKFPIRDGDTVTGLGAIVTDITDRVETERELRASEERMRAITSNIPGCVYRRVLHPDGTSTVPYVSWGIELLSGVPAEDMIENPELFVERVHPDDRARWRSVLEDSARDLSIYEIDFRMIRPDGEERWCRAHARPHAGPDGEIIWDGVTLDVTELKKTERALNLAREQAIEANQAKSEFLARMSHELRTPMNAIIGFSEAIAGELHGPLENARYAGYVADIHSSGQHLLSLINEILDLARIEAGEATMTEEAVDIADVIHDSARILATRIDSGAIQWRDEIEPGLPSVRADRRMLKQILLNLLSNAEKFSEEGGRVWVAAGKNGEGNLEISVSDEGIGIRKSELRHVMDPFQQAGNPMIRDYEGTGLGLYLVRVLTEQHGGTVEIASEEGEGTTVRIVLPASRIIAGDALPKKAAE